MNPRVYPEWWGEEETSPKRGGQFKCPKRLKSADPCKAKINKAIKRHCEDSLDKRLRMVYEAECSTAAQAQPSHWQQPPSSHCYAYTKQQNVSPIRTALPGQNNVPMTYSGPPCRAELQRNSRRRGNGHVDQSSSNIVFGH